MAIPLRVTLQRFVYLSLVMAAFGLMLLGKAETLVAERLRMSVVDTMAPVMRALAAPAATASDVVASFRSLIDIRGENAVLREENRELSYWRAAARRLEAENATLRGLLNQVHDSRARYVTARVIGDAGGAFVRTVVVNAGARDGVIRGQAAVAPNGLVGRVVAAGPRAARLLLITDLNSRIPVLLEGSRARAILEGNNGDRPRLAFLPANASVALGERVVTSGHGGLFPPGLPVGEVTAVGEAGIWVRPFARLDALEFVRVIDFQPIEPPDPAPAASDAKKDAKKSEVGP